VFRIRVRWSSKAAVCGLAAGMAYAQLSTNAYRGLGQADLRQNGINRVQGVELFAPFAIALDDRDGHLHLYVADTRNHRVMAWEDARSYQIGDSPALILGQPGPSSSIVLGIGVKGFDRPVSLAVDPVTGNLYVADFGNNRVLRFLSPFRNRSRVEPDSVYGQADFNARNANPAGVAKNSMRGPQAVAFDAAGNLWVADTGNNRVLRFSAPILDTTNPDADLVVGQTDFGGGGPDRSGAGVSGAGFNEPAGLAFDAQNNLYVADFLNTRVLKFAPPYATAAQVFGEPDFKSRGVPSTASNQTLAGPAGICVDSSGNLYVAVPADNRVLVFATDGGNGVPARAALGQSGFTATLANAGAFPQASSGSLYGPTDVKVDAAGNVYIADTSNNRVLSLPANNRNARQVWGQIDFTSNGVNQVKASGLNAPRKVVVDYSQSPYPLYVSDTNNNRVLAWKDASRFRNGDPADLVIGQPNFSTAASSLDAQGVHRPTALGLSSPTGLALDGAGNLYVADTDNNRVLRYPTPVLQSSQIAPDLVLGQPDFTSYSSAVAGSKTLRGPGGVAIGPDGNIFVSDTGNNRVLEFAAGSASGADAIRIYGHTNSAASAADPTSAQSLNNPQGIYVDAAYTLYVADMGANRVLIFPNTRSAPAAGDAAGLVIGNDLFDTVASAGSGASRFQNPSDVMVDNSGTIYVSDTGNNRVLLFPSFLFLPVSGGTAAGVMGQRDLSGRNANWDSPDGLATADGLASPLGIFVDRRGTLYVADAANNRVTHFLTTATMAHAAYAQASSVAPGSLVIMSGPGLTDDQQTAQPPLPFALANRTVLVNDEIAAPLLAVTPGQIVLELPSTTPVGMPQIALRTADTGELIAGVTFPVVAYAPGLFTGGVDAPVKTLNQDGSANTATNAALRGTTIQLYGTGQGPVSPVVSDGQAAPAAVNTIAAPTADGQACLVKQPSVCVAVGNTFGDISFSGLAPGMVGVWRIDVRIPQNAPTGNVSVRAVINGAPTNLITVAIK